ncbi:MAG TPA: HD domain-containing protein [Puia sp.]|jgi:predicted metal-dependent HD superfamily phosphohydrolase
MEKVLSKVKIFVTELFSGRNLSFLIYHNLRHTETVVDRANEMATYYEIDDTEKFCLISAAWFHDTGHLFNELADHEKTGCDLMTSFLRSFFIDEKLISKISDCIYATKIPSDPKTLNEKIICDADTYHFGTKEFRITDPKVYEEMEARLHVHIDNKVDRSIQLLESHRFFTDYCQNLLNKGKQENIDFLKSAE